MARRPCAAGMLVLVVLLAACSQKTELTNPERVRVTTFEGDPRAIGLQHGRALADEISQFYGEFLRNAVFPYLNRQHDALLDVLRVYTLSDLYDVPNFGRQILLEAAKSVLDSIPQGEQQEFVEEIRGISEGSGLPFDDTMILNTFLDSLTSILNVNNIISGLENPRIAQVEFESPSLPLADPCNGVAGGTPLPPAGGRAQRCVFSVSRRSSPFALARGIPPDAKVVISVADQQLTCGRVVTEEDPACRPCEEGEEPGDPPQCFVLSGERLQFGEGVDLNNPVDPESPDKPGLLKVNGVFADRCETDAAGCAGYKDNGTGSFPNVEPVRGAQTVFTLFPPEGGWLTGPGETNVVELRILDLARTNTTPPEHAHNMRKERFAFLASESPATVPDTRTLTEFPSLIPNDRLDAEMFAMAVQGSASADGRLRVLRHFQLLDLDVAHKYARIFVYKPTGKRAYMSLAWSGFAPTISGMNDRGLVAAANWAETQDDSTIRGAVPALAALSDDGALDDVLLERIRVAPVAGEAGRVRDAAADKTYACRRPDVHPNDAFAGPQEIAEDDFCCEVRLVDDEAADNVAAFDPARDLCRVRSCFLGPADGGGARDCTFGVKSCENGTCRTLGGVLQPQGVPIGIRIRKILEASGNLNEAIDRFREGPSAAGWNVLLADGSADDGDPAPQPASPDACPAAPPGAPAPAAALVEIDAGAPLNLVELLLRFLGIPVEDSRGFRAERDVACARLGDARLADRGVSVSEGLGDVRACSHYQLNVPDSAALGPISLQSVWSPRFYTSTDTCGLLARAVRERQGTLDGDTLEDVLRDPAVVSVRGSMHAAIFDPAMRSARVVLGQVPATLGPLNEFTCEDLGFDDCPEAP